MGHLWKTSRIWGILLIALTFSSCSSHGGTQDSPKNAASKSVLVKVARAAVEEIPDEITAIGNAEPYNAVSVQSQVSGKLLRVYFREGENLSKGELLFLVDPAPFQIALNQSNANLNKDMATVAQTEANLSRDIAQYQYARLEAWRYKKLLKENYASAEQANQMEANAASLSATVLADKAAIQTARKAVQASREAVAGAELNLGYCSIRAPITGKAGSILIRPGNLVTAQSSTLVTINQIEPIYVDFSVPEQKLPEIKSQMAARKLPVQASTQGSGKIERGLLSFVNNAVDPTTGTIELKGTFQNNDLELWPGEFVNTTLILRRIPNAVMVPSQAVQNGQIGTYVFVVNSGNAAEIRKVAIGPTYRGMTWIEKGIQAGETVVTDGQINLYPRAPVSIQP